MASSSDELPDELMIIDDSAVSTSHTVASCKYADDFDFVIHHMYGVKIFLVFMVMQSHKVCRQKLSYCLNYARISAHS